MLIKGFSIDSYLRDLEEIVNIDSKTYDLDGINQVRNFFIKKFQDLDCIVEPLESSNPDSPLLKVTNKSTDFYDFLLVGHMDTVFPRGTVADRPFKINGDLAFGPGVCDMKSGLLVAYHLMKMLKGSELGEKINICIVFNSDEETGSLASTNIIEEIAQRSKYAFILEPGRGNFTYVVKRKGTAKFKISFNGISAHAGASPEKGRSAITEMAHFITKTDLLNNYDAQTTLNTGVVTGGTAPNVVASYASMILDLRFSNITEYDRIVGVLNEMAENPVIGEVKIKIDRVSFRSPMNPNDGTNHMTDVLKHIAKESGVTICFEKSGGVSDGNTIAALGVPVLDSAGPVGGNTHNENEYIEINSIEKRIYLLWKLINELACKWYVQGS